MAVWWWLKANLGKTMVCGRVCVGHRSQVDDDDLQSSLHLPLILKVTRKNHQRTRIEEVEEEEEEREYHHQRAYKYVQNSQRIVISV